MKKIIVLFAVLLVLSGCFNSQNNQSSVNSPEQGLQKLVQGNDKYINNRRNNADISIKLRESTASMGQKPYAVIVTCSDSRVPPEHIFSAGIGELFVVRTAGNVIDNFVLGSIEYGVKHLGAKVIVIMGHDQCGAVSAAMAGHAEGHITYIVEEIKSAIEGAVDSIEAERLNITHSYLGVMESTLVKELLELNEIVIVQAKYEMQTGRVTFF